MISTSELVDKIKNEAPKVRLTCEPLGINTERFIVEGDIGLSTQAVVVYAAKRIAIARAALNNDPDAQRQGLLGIEKDGRTLRWRPGKKLSYCVWRPSFNSDAEYAEVVAGMQSATADWESLCGIAFEYNSAKDTDENLALNDVTFPVLRQAGGGQTVAMAFFPDDVVNERLVWVFDGYFGSSGFDPVGVMRHELGHVLGFRHEHIRPEAPDLFNPESTEHTVEITEYDPQSVMHYVAQGVGNPLLTFTGADRRGAREVYGRPDAEFTFAD